VVGDRGMVSQKTLEALEGSDPPVGYIIRVRMRRQKEVNLSGRKHWLETTTVNSGFFRTELLTEESTNLAERAIEDYNKHRAKQMEFWKATTVSSPAIRPSLLKR
jgi:hypothetical protein